MTKEQRKFSGEGRVFVTNGAGTTGHPHAEKLVRRRPCTFHKNSLKIDIIALNVKQKTIILLEDIIGENIDGPGFGSDFLDTISKEKNWLIGLH